MDEHGQWRERFRKCVPTELLLENGMAESREQAQALIMAGLVYAPDGRVLKPGTAIASDTRLEVKGRLPYVSRGGIKLAHVLERFGLDVSGLVALDVGASTGGFTDCLLQHGALRGYRPGRGPRPARLPPAKGSQGPSG